MRIYCFDRRNIGAGWLVLLFLLMTVSGSVKASTIYQALYQVNVNANNVVSNQSGSTSVSASVMGYVGPNNWFSNAQGIAAPNQLGIYADAENGPGGVSSIAQATASLTDAVSLTNAPSSGTLLLYVNVQGSQLAAASGPISGALTYTQLSAGTSCVSVSNTSGAYPPTNPIAMSNCGSLNVGSNVLSVPYTNSNDVPFTLSFKAIGDCAPTFAPCTADSNYLHTAQISSFAVEDASGTLFPTATVTSLSGVNYTVPEVDAASFTGSVALLIGLLCIARGGRRPIETLKHSLSARPGSGVEEHEFPEQQRSLRIRPSK